MENAILFAIVGLMLLLGVTAPNLLQSLVRPILLALAVASIALYMRWGTLPFHDGKPTPPEAYWLQSFVVNSVLGVLFGGLGFGAKLVFNKARRWRTRA